MTHILVQFEASSAWMSDTGTASISTTALSRIIEDQEPIWSNAWLRRGGLGSFASADVMMNSGNLLHTNYHLRQTNYPPLVVAASFKEAALPSS